MINSTDIRYFIEVAQTLHLTRASERLGVSQPALSHCLKRLEAEVGVPLFIRSKKGVELTRAGKRLEETSRALLQNWEDLVKSAQEEVHCVRGPIRLGCHSAVAQYTLPLFLPSFLEEYPELIFELRHGLSRHMVEEVISDRLDVAIAVNPIPHLDLVIRELMVDTVTLWGAKDCKNKNLLIMEPSLIQTQNILTKLKRKGFHFSRTMESPSLEVIAQLVSSGTGLGILPERVARAFGSDKILSIAGAPHLSDRVCLVYKNEFTKSARGRAFKEAFVKFHKV